MVIDAVINKYSFHLPLYRQSVILERESGLHLSRATLNGWMMRVGEMLTRIVTAMGQELLTGNYIQADETPVAGSKSRSATILAWFCRDWLIVKSTELAS